MNNNKKTIDVLARAFYGDLTMVTTTVDRIDRIITGKIGSYAFPVIDDFEKVEVNIPNTNIVLMYDEIENKERKEYGLSPMEVSSKLGLVLYSRWVACRKNENGEYESFVWDEDMPKVKEYLA